MNEWPDSRRHAAVLCRVLSLAVVLTAALSLAVGPARGLDSDVFVAYTQACDGQDVTLTVTASELVGGEEVYFVLLRDGVTTSSPTFFADAYGNATTTFAGLPSSSTVVVNVDRGGTPSILGLAGPFSLIDCSPSAQLNALVGQVQSLNLSAGIANSLDAKLSHIEDALAAARNNAVTVACNSLNAFINDVAAQAQQQVITAAQASSLTNAALSIKKALGCL